MLNKGNKRILFIGDPQRGLEEPGELGRYDSHVCSGLMEGIKSAAGRGFDLVAVTMSDSPHFGEGLRGLREVCGSSKLVLLVRMDQEPEARELILSSMTGQSVVDEYLICPVKRGHLEEIFDAFEESQSGSLLSSSRDYVEVERQRMQELERLATEDELTGLKNRRYLWEFSRQVIERFCNEGTVTLLLFDIDNFKQYNDHYGHPSGDEILKQVGELMKRCCRSHDVVGRVGGDEFSVVFWDNPAERLTDAEKDKRRLQKEPPREVLFIADRFQRELRKTEFEMLGPQGQGVLSISGGLASFPRDGETVDELFSQADKALLQAKEQGKDRIYIVGKPLDALVSS